jgi:hypothetical protein
LIDLKNDNEGEEDAQKLRIEKEKRKMDIKRELENGIIVRPVLL